MMVWMPMQKKLISNLAIIPLLVGLQGCFTDTSDYEPSDNYLSSEPFDGEDQGDSRDQNHFYFSYDDSASTASRDLTLFALNSGKIPHASLGRAYEYLNAEQIGQFDSSPVGPFQVSMGLMQVEAGELAILSSEESVAALGVSVSGPIREQSERENIVLTLLVDVSGSMASWYAPETANDISTLLDVTKLGLSEMHSSLKDGDVVNLVTFSTQASVLLEGWEFDEGNNELQQEIDALETISSTNLDAGIQLAYAVAARTYDQAKSNRVLILTDAYANVGQVNSSVIAQSVFINELEGIHFSGVGIGDDFNDAFLNELTELGKGSYASMITPQDAERLFTEEFIRFIDVAVEDVVFRLDYPSSWRHISSAAEETSLEQGDIQPINFAFNSDQFFYEGFELPSESGSDEEFTLTIEYRAESGEIVSKTITKTVEDMSSVGEDEILSASAVVTLANLVSEAIDCEDIQGSSLLESTSNHPVFIKYTAAIDTFCSLSTPN